MFGILYFDEVLKFFSEDPQRILKNVSVMQRRYVDKRILHPLEKIVADFDITVDCAHNFDETGIFLNRDTCERTLEKYLLCNKR